MCKFENTENTSDQICTKISTVANLLPSQHLHLGTGCKCIANLIFHPVFKPGNRIKQIQSFFGFSFILFSADSPSVLRLTAAEIKLCSHVASIFLHFGN